jgi:hypothetical protein
MTPLIEDKVLEDDALVVVVKSAPGSGRTNDMQINTVGALKAKF